MYDRRMTLTNPVSALREWRPQLFGTRKAQDVTDPLIEPFWTGPRGLVLVDGDAVDFVDSDGETVELDAAVVDELRAATGARLLLEAVLTSQPLQQPDDLVGRDRPPAPTAGEAMGQMMLGSRRGRRSELARDAEEAARRSSMPVDEYALVAVDLLWIDDQPLLDIPLLERRRVLEAELAESRLIRRGIHVRLPVDPWIGPWRLFGFGSMAYKAANSRYRPGEPNQDWAIARIPSA
jgi:hypothetical protein